MTPVIVNVIFYNATLKIFVADLTVVSFYFPWISYSSVFFSMCSRIWTLGWDQLTSVCVSHHVTSPHIKQVPLHHSRVPTPLPGHQLREVPLEARIHDWLLFIETEDVFLSLKWSYLPPVVNQIAFLHNETWKILIVFNIAVRQTDQILDYM